MVQTMSGTLMAMTSLSHLELQSVDAIKYNVLEAYKTNNDTKIIAGCPARLDFGTEKGHVAEMQQFLHFSDNQAERDSFGWTDLTS